MKFRLPHKAQGCIKHRKPLTRQVSIGTLVILLTTVTLAFQYIYRHTASILFERNQKISHNQLESAERRMTDIFDNMYSNINILLYNEEVLAISREKKTVMDYSYLTRVKSLTSFLHNMQYESDYVHSIYIFINDNVYFSSEDFCSIPGSFGDIPILQSAYYQELCSSVYRTAYSTEHKVSDFSSYKNAITDDIPLITLGCAASGTNTKRVILINIDTLELGNQLASCFDDDSIVFLFDESGQLLACTEAAKGTDLFSTLLQWKSNGKIWQSPVVLNDKRGQLVYKTCEVNGLTIAKYISNAEIHQDSFRIGTRFLVVFFIFGVISFLLMRYWISRCLRPINTICQKMDELETGNLGTQIDLATYNELDDLIQHFNHMSSSLAKMDAKNQQMAHSLRILELQALRTQLNPHFIFNTLNMLKWMAVKYNADELEECLIALAEILYPIFREDSEMIPLKKEVHSLEKYVLILHYRFDRKVTLDISLDPALENILIPRLIMQPIVENCVQHGHYNNGSTLVIHITMQIEDGTLEISVSDNGQGMDRDRLEQLRSSLAKGDALKPDARKHVGLANVHQRIQLHYSAQYGLSIWSEQGKGTTVTIRLPSLT